MYQHTSFLDVVVTLKMPRKERAAVHEGNGPIHQYVMPGGITLENFRRALSEMRGEIIGEVKEDLTCLDQRLSSLEQFARPRLAMEADGPANTKTRERTEGAATAVQAIHGNSFSASRVDSSPTTKSISFGVKA